MTIWRVDYVRYRNPKFSGQYYAYNKADAERVAEKLRLLKHISSVRIVATGQSSKQQEGKQK